MRISHLFTSTCTLAFLAATTFSSPAADGQERWREFLARGQAGQTPLGGVVERSISVGGVSRSYLVHVPPSYHPDRAIPLVLSFHGGGGDMKHMAREDTYDITGKSDRAGFIVVFPNGTGAVGKKFATWNAGACCGKARDEQADDVAFARALVADLQRSHAIDAKRIFAMGMSNGGMMSYRLACEAADIFAGIASVAGTDNTVACSPSRPISVLHIHAHNDDHVLFEGGAGAGAFRDESKINQFVSVPQTIAKWTAHDACRGPVGTVLTVPGATCEVHQGCAEGAKVELCVTEDGKHSWPGSAITTLSRQAPSQAISANDVIWAFFQSLPLRQ